MRPVGIRTARLVLDEPTLADADLVAEYCRDPLFERYLTTPWPYSRADAEAFLGVFVPESWASGTELTWAIRACAGRRTARRDRRARAARTRSATGWARPTAVPGS